MDPVGFETDQVYEGQPGYEAPSGESAAYGSGGSAAASHQLQGGSVRDSRMHSRYEDPRDQARPGYGRGGSGSLKNRKGLLGLSNLGNTCFMNAALQCLTHTHGLQKYFRFCSHAYTSKSDKSKGPSTRQKLLLSFAHWFERDWGKNVTAPFHSPEDIFRAVQQLNPTFQGYSQQDAQEFLRCVLDNMHEELRREIPDDLHKRYGVDLNPQGGGSSSSTQGGGLDGVPSERRQLPWYGDGGEPVSPSGRRVASSTASHLMQLCNATEGSTDVGEIRVPPAKPATPQPSGFGQSASGGAAVSSAASPWESSSIASSSSGHPAGGGFGAVGPSGGFGASSSSSAPAAASQAAGGHSAGDAPAEGGGAEQKESSGGEPPSHFSSIVSELFQGHVVSTVRCLECQRLSTTKEPFQDVSVQIPNSNELVPNGQAAPPGVYGQDAPGSSASVGSNGSGSRGGIFTGMLGGLTGKVKNLFYDKGVEVTDCLRKFCAPEYLVGKDKYDCEHCKRKTDGERRFAFKDLPEVLCIHIKRFRYDASWFNATKNSRPVTFPVNKVLDMSSFVDEPPQYPIEYRLIGLIQHNGSMGGGHYISYCRHKRKPQEWYEFDDTQVNQVAPETVERAEPYVLFYQRVPTKGGFKDRQTFKNEHKKMQTRIRDHLLSLPPSAFVSAAPSGSSAANHMRLGGGSSSSTEEAVAEEMRLHGPVLRNVYRNPPAELDMVFVTKYWYVKLTTMCRPGPLDNFEHLCPHGLLGCASIEMAAEPFTPISRALYQSLVQKYGGGPAITSMEVCAKCQAHIRSYNERKTSEYDLVTKYDTKDTGDGKGWYIVDALWVNKWKLYAKSDNVNDIHDMSKPGPVTNDRLHDKKTGQIRSGLKLRIDYIGVNARVWWLFKHVHGGGPDICREELDIYSADYRLETELKLEELRPQGPNVDFSIRMSHLFVDECQGDFELYRERFGQGLGSDAAVATTVSDSGAGASNSTLDGPA